MVTDIAAMVALRVLLSDRGLVQTTL